MDAETNEAEEEEEMAEAELDEDEEELEEELADAGIALHDPLSVPS